MDSFQGVGLHATEERLQVHVDKRAIALACFRLIQVVRGRDFACEAVDSFGHGAYDHASLLYVDTLPLGRFPRKSNCSAVTQVSGGQGFAGTSDMFVDERNLPATYSLVQAINACAFP